MKIAFMGKGGSGKTTLAAAFVNFAKNKYSQILAIDSDINRHLQHSLGIEGDSLNIGDYFEEIAEYTEGTRWKNYGFDKVPKIGSIPVSNQSKFIRISNEDPFMKKFALIDKNLFLFTVGAYEDEDHGDACYHGKLASLEITMHRIVEDRDQIVVSDVTAGLDPISTSLILAYDIIFLIIEPGLKGVSIYNDVVNTFGSEFENKVRVVLNKVRSNEDIAFIEKYIPKNEIVAIFRFSLDVRRFEQNVSEGLQRFVLKEQESFEKLRTIISSKNKDWDSYKKSLDDLFKKRCIKWYTSYYGIDPDRYIDPEFTYKKLLDTHA